MSVLTEAAISIGDRICGSAERTSAGYRWFVRAFASGSDVPPLELTGPTIYSGASGIALFLAELHGITGDSRTAEVARGAMRQVISQAHARDRLNIGFHTGISGIAYALDRVGVLTHDESLRAAAAEMVTRISGLEQTDGSFDVIGGAGGAIPALLSLYQSLDSQAALDSAVALAHHAARNAKRMPDGWCWSTSRAGVRGLTGYAHGASGIGLAILEVAQITGDEFLKYAAEQAFAYEQAWFVPRKRNWSDLRVSDLTRLNEDELRTAVRSGARFRWDPDKVMLAWCHGAPGIGLARLRAYELTGETYLRDEARVAVNTTRMTLAPTASSSYCVCHGLAGNCETLLAASAQLGDTEALKAVHAWLQVGVDRFERAGQSWPSGVPGAAPDLSLMLGDAGIGHMLLRVEHPGVPSILRVTPARCTLPSGFSVNRNGETRQQLQLADVDRHFGSTLRISRRLLDDHRATNGSIDDPAVEAPPRAPARAAARALRRRADAMQDQALRERLLDAALVDENATAMLGEDLDHTIGYLEGVAREPADEVDWTVGAWRLSELVRVVTPRWDWEKWLEHKADSRDRPLLRGRPVLLVRRGYEVRQFAVEPFANAVFAALATPRPLDEIVDCVGETMGSAAVDAVRDAVVTQLREAYAAAIVVRAWEADARALTEQSAH